MGDWIYNVSSNLTQANETLDEAIAGQCAPVNPINAEYFVYSAIDIALVIVFMPIVFIVGVIGNASVVYVFFRVAHMRTVTNYYLVSLAMADLCFLCSAVPVFWVQYASSNVQIDHSAISVGFCKVVIMFSPDMCFIVSTSTVVVLTVERYVAICWPMKFKTMSTKPRAVTTIVLTWVFAAVLKSPQIFFADMVPLCLDWSGYTNDTSLYPDQVVKCDFCNVPQHGQTICFIWRKILTLDSLLILLVIPLITTLYSLIVVQLRRLSKTSATSSAASSTRMKQQVVRMLMVTIAVFITCITPFRVLNLLSIWDYKFPKHLLWGLVNMARILQYTNSAVNPLIYNIMSDKYRQSFKEAFGFICMCCPTIEKKRLGGQNNHVQDGELKPLQTPTQSSKI